jgi:mono/diheme cytochrome c family protein
MQARRRILNSELLIVNCVLSLAAVAFLTAQTTKTVWDGVYTDEQARRGEALAKSKCQACHGERLTGDMGPPLAGSDFLSGWNGKPASDLFDKIRTTMPQGEEGTLSANQTADLLAYLFQLSKFPSGAVEIGSDASSLAQIQIQTTK